MKKLLATIVVAVCAAFTASAAKIDLSTVTANKTLANGDVAYGTLGANVKVSIAAGATVTLSNAVVVGATGAGSPWAGITCLGDATIVLEGDSSVRGFYEGGPGVQVPAGSTLAITGGGSLTARGIGAAGVAGSVAADDGRTRYFLLLALVFAVVLPTLEILVRDSDPARYERLLFHKSH